MTEPAEEPAAVFAVVSCPDTAAPLAKQAKQAKEVAHLLSKALLQADVTVAALQTASCTELQLCEKTRANLTLAAYQACLASRTAMRRLQGALHNLKP